MYKGHKDWIDLHPTHEVSIVGWGSSPRTTANATATKFWIVRNSWGEYWGELSFFRLEMGYNLLGIESQVAWAIPGNFTTVENTVHCHEDGSNCDGGDESVRLVQHFWNDPSMNGIPFGRRVLL